MTPPASSRFRRIVRLLFRIVRTTVVVLLIFLLTLAAYLNWWGLPEPLEQELISQFRARGIDLSFTRIRFRWSRGIIAENVSLGPANDSTGARLYATQARLYLNREALRQRKLEPEAIVLREGRLDLAVTSPDQRAHKLAIQNLHGELWFPPDGRWELRNLEGRALGVMIKLSGNLTNALELWNWRFPERPKAKERATNFWYQLVMDLQKIRAASPAELTGIISGDARDVRSFNIKLIFLAPSLASPWGSGRDMLLSTVLIPGVTATELPRFEMRLHIDQLKTRWGEAGALRLNADFLPLLFQQWLTNSTSDGSLKVALATSLSQPWLTNLNGRVQLKAAQTRWGRADNLRLDAHVQPDHSNTNRFHTDLKVLADRIHTDWCNGTNWIDVETSQLTVRLAQALTNLIPVGATGQVEMAKARTPWGNAQQARFRFDSQRIDANAVFKAR